MNLKRLMDLRGMNQVELADKSKVSQPLISRYLRGEVEPNLDNVLSLAKALRCSVEELAGIEIKKEPAPPPKPIPAEYVALAEAILALDPNDPKRKAIEAIIMNALKMIDGKS